MKGWYSWLTGHVPNNIKTGVTNAFNTMARKVNKFIYGEEQEEEQWHGAQEEQQHDARIISVLVCKTDTPQNGLYLMRILKIHLFS